MIHDPDFSRLPERRLQLIQVESFLLITALLSQLAFIFWMGFGTRSMNAVREFINEPILWVLFAANLVCWSLVFVVRFFWQGFDYGANEDLQTGLYHRSYFERILEMEIRRSGRYHYPATLCLLDIDRFTSLNQSFGRKHGDEVLRKFAEFLRSSVRLTDLIARYERDEFCVLLPHTDLVKAEKFISRIVAQAQERLDCSFSAGLTGFHAGENRAQLLERASLALELAKREGIGKVRCLLSGQDSQAILSF
mgnify:CR=1 FL=1